MKKGAPLSVREVIRGFSATATVIGYFTILAFPLWGLVKYLTEGTLGLCAPSEIDEPQVCMREWLSAAAAAVAVFVAAGATLITAIQSSRQQAWQERRAQKDEAIALFNSIISLHFTIQGEWSFLQDFAMTSGKDRESLMRLRSRILDSVTKIDLSRGTLHARAMDLLQEEEFQGTFGPLEESWSKTSSEIAEQAVKIAMGVLPIAQGISSRTYADIEEAVVKALSPLFAEVVIASQRVVNKASDVADTLLTRGKGGG